MSTDTTTTDGDEIRLTDGLRTELQTPARLLAGQPEHGVGFQLWRAANAWQRAINEALDPLGLTHVQYILLAALTRLERDEAIVTQAMLARHAGTDEMMTSQVARHLEARGLIERESHPTDARAKSISTTEAGARLVELAGDVVEVANGRFFAALDGDLETLREVLRRITSFD
jgi:DNA-binding MarR family transcriptional regulator